MTNLNYEQSPPCGQTPPASFRTSTPRTQNILPDSFATVTLDPPNLAVTPPSRRTYSELLPAPGIPWHCAECPAVSTPLRRRGPQGRQTLCNACGIRYGKRMKEAKRANQTDSGTIVRTLRDRDNAQTDVIQPACENETPARKRSRGVSKSNKRRKLERQPEGQCFNSHLLCAVAPVVSQQETGNNLHSLNNGFEIGSDFKADVPQDVKTLTLTDDDTHTRAEHATRERVNVEDAVMRTEPLITSPPIPESFSDTRESFPNHPSLVDQVACVNALAFFAPVGSTAIDIETRNHETENAITPEEVESKLLTGKPSPPNAYQLTPTRLEGQPMQVRLQYVDDDATGLHTDQNTDSKEKISTAREIKSAVLGCSKRSASQAAEIMSFLQGSIGWSDDFAQGYGETVPTTQENIQSENTKHEHITSVKQTFDENDKEGLVMQCTGTLSRLQDMNARISRDINDLSERITRFAKKNEELEVAGQEIRGLIQQLTSEKNRACTKQTLLWNNIAKVYSLLEHLRQ